MQIHSERKYIEDIFDRHSIRNTFKFLHLITFLINCFARKFIKYIDFNLSYDKKYFFSLKM